MAYRESEYHKQLMQAYYAARDAFELRKDEECRGYATEEKEYEKTFTFKEFLIGMAR